MNESTHAEKITNHWGVTVDSREPITGVISNDSAAWLVEEPDHGIDLDYEDACTEAMAQHTHEDRCECQVGVACTCGECDTCECLMDGYYDGGDGGYLIGSWAQGTDGLYAPDTSGAYAAIYRAGANVTQVVWSRWVSRAALCSPCYPGQADLDTAGDYLAYQLPPALFGDEDEHLEIIESRVHAE